MIERNTANAQHSTGPRTPEGKRRSSLNAVRHQITGTIHIATEEESEAFRQHCQAYHETMPGSGAVEGDLIHEIAENRWRIKRIHAIENAIFAQGFRRYVDDMQSGEPQIDAALTQGETWVQKTHALQLLSLYEGRILRAIEKNLALLKNIQAERKAAHDAAEAEAIRQFQLAQAEGREYRPTFDFDPPREHGGFVFSLPSIRIAIDWRDRVERAAKLAGSGQSN